MRKPPKLGFDKFKDGMVPFLHFPAVESEIKNEKMRRLRQAEKVVTESESYESVEERLLFILDAENAQEYKARMRLILGTTMGGSWEALDRVCMVVCPEQDTWPKRFKSKEATEKIVRFLVNPELYEAVPWFTAERYRLPPDWDSRLRDNMSRGIHKGLQSLYSTKSGLALEKMIHKTITDAGYEYAKGPVSWVDNKEVDAVIPDMRQPHVLIMSSYNLTTGSGQTARATEQKSMYECICRYNSARANYDKQNIQFVNVIDGGGWISRESDLKIMHQHCDYALAASQLHRLPDILKYHMLPDALREFLADEQRGSCLK